MGTGTGLSSAEALWKELESAWKAAGGDAAALAKAERLIAELKVELLVKTKAVTVGVEDGGGESARAAILYRSCLELSAQAAAAKGQLQNFQRAMDQLMEAYAQSPASLPKELAVSDNLHHMLGLRIMAHLADGNLGAFHMELDRIPPADQANVYVRWPLELEQAFVLGSYARIFQAAESMPSPFYRAFWALLVETVRSEIGACFEAAYKRLSLSEAARLLFYTPSEAKAALPELAAARGWSVADGVVFFAPAKAKAAEEEQASLSASHTHAKRLLGYATTLEAIP